MKSVFVKYCEHASPFVNYSTLAFIACTALFFNHYWLATGWLIYFPLGIFSWTLLEYFLHRFIFHLRSKKRSLNHLTYYIHGVHHEYSNTTNYVPFLQNILFYGFGLLVSYFILGKMAAAFYTGFIAAVVLQVYLHNLVHTAKSTHFIKLQHHHQFHHQHPAKNFGISTRFWDWVFGTLAN